MSEASKGTSEVSGTEVELGPVEHGELGVAGEVRKE
jgi:hypothetical protein